MSSRFFKVSMVGIVWGLLVPVQSLAEVSWGYSVDVLADVNRYDGSLFEDRIGEVNGSEAYLRRLKFSLESGFGSRMSGRISVDYNEIADEIQIDDAWLRYDLNRRYALTFGHFKEPGGMEQRSGLKYQYFLERSVATNLFSYARKDGLGLDIDGKGWLLEMAAMRVKSKQSGFDSGFAYVLHGSYNPYRSESKTNYVHVGASVSQRDNTELRYDIDEPLIAYSTGNLIHSPNYNGETVDTQSIEAAFAYARVALQTELFTQTVNTRTGQSYEHGGYYVSAAWNVFGTLREYRKGKVRFYGKMQPTLELALRQSHADTTNFGDGDIADVLSVAVNYYFSKKIRLSLEYEKADLDNYDEGDLLVLDGDSLNARVQLVF